MDVAHVGLEEWHNRLVRHYRNLQVARDPYPVFVLEHAIEENDRRKILSEVRAKLDIGPPMETWWLPFVIYAAELGYRYSGIEYWQTFQEETPGWLIHGDRKGVRDWFERFRDEFNGASPSGPWAGHFKNIAWPITHAILPRDFQFRLARLLHDCLGRRAATIADPSTLGHYLSARAYRYGKRFQEFSENEALLGQVAFALLHEADDASELIEHRALARIVDDLEQVQQAGDWLRSARERVRQGIRGMGIAGHRRTGQLPDADDDFEGVSLDLAPRLSLRLMGHNKWDVLITIPDLAPLVLRHPEFVNEVQRRRCRVNGCDGPPLAAGCVLDGRQQVKVSRWPDPTRPLLTFDPSIQEVENLLPIIGNRTEWPRVFKVGVDGTATELQSRTVRPAHSYIVLQQSEFSASRPNWTRSVEISAEGIVGIGIHVPDFVDDGVLVSLAALGLAPATQIRLTPVGTAYADWDGDGRAEWRNGVEILLALSADEPIVRATVEFENKRLDLDVSSKPIFVSFGCPPVGAYLAKAIVCTSSEPSVEVVGLLSFDVREPSLERNPKSSALRILSDPSVATIDELWNGKAELDVIGPVGVRGQMRVSLYRREQTPITEAAIGGIELPVVKADWPGLLERFRNAGELQSQLGRASELSLSMVVADVGRAKLSFERRSEALRWIPVWNRRGLSKLDLLDDTGEAAEPVIKTASFAEPGNAMSISKFERLSEGEYVLDNPSGGVYTASQGDMTTAIICAPVRSTGDFASMSQAGQVQSPPRRPGDLCSLNEIAATWSKAVAIDVVASMQKAKVLDQFAITFSSVVCGPRWEAAERQYERSRALSCFTDLPQWRGSLQEVIAAVDASALCRLSVTERMASIRKVFVASDVFTIRSSTLSRELCVEFSIRSSTNPGTLSEWAGDNHTPLIEVVLDNPMLLRMARSIAIWVQNAADPAAAVSDIWVWN